MFQIVNSDMCKLMWWLFVVSLSKTKRHLSHFQDISKHLTIVHFLCQPNTPGSGRIEPVHRNKSQNRQKNTLNVNNFTFFQSRLII